MTLPRHYFDPIEVLSATTAFPVPLLTVTPNDALLRLKLSRPRKADLPEEITFDVHPEYLARELSRIPGFTASYVDPVHIPGGAGAVVLDSAGEPWVRVFPRAGHGHIRTPWQAPGNATRVMDDYISGILTRGGTVLSEGVELP